MKNTLILAALLIFISCSENELHNQDNKNTAPTLVETTRDTTIYKVVEEMPRFPGCEHLPQDERKQCSDKKLFNHIYKNIKYFQTIEKQAA